MRKIFFLALAIILLAAFSLNFGLVSAKESDNLKLRVFEHFPAKGAGKGKPLPPPNCTVTVNDQVNDYGLAGWQMPTFGVNYRLNLATKPRNLSEATILSAMDSSFAAWTTADANQVFKLAGTTTVKTPKRDGVNAVFWKGISGSALAITYIWYNQITGELVEVDTAFNSTYTWSYTDPSAGDCGGPTASYDLRDIATHEFGHWIGLDDLYANADKDLTMYGYGERSELKKDSLSMGDISGVLAVAP